MKNRKGFTLVELLAVIVILAVVVLIAVTAVIPRMNKARKNAFLDEAMVYMKAAKEAYISNETTECYNVADMGELVKQNKSGYSGTIYVNEKGVSLNLSNGKYYIKTNGNPTTADLLTTKPSNYIDSCSDTSKTYTISYDLGGGTVATANPTSYNQNTPTITLNNPIKANYKFIGWSSKNLFNVDSVYKDCYITSNNGQKYDYYSADKPWDCSDFIEIKPNTTYRFNPNNSAGGDFTGHSVYNASKNFLQSYPTGAATMQTPSDAKYMRVSYRSNNSYDIQLEEGSTSTDYQEYMAPTTTAKIYRGSTGNKKFIANYTDIFKVTLDNQGATSSGTEYVYYQYNKYKGVNGVTCYYYTDKELTACITNGSTITRPQKTGYTFKGYYTEPNGSGIKFVTDAGVFTNNIYKTYLDDVTLYAYWVAN